MDQGENRDYEGSKWFDENSLWDESKWEIFMQAEDEKTNLFLQKFTKSIDLPNCEEFITRELNGDYDDEDEIECPHDGIDCSECPDFDECRPFADDETESVDDEWEVSADFRTDPIWKKAYDIAVRLQHLSRSKSDIVIDRDPLFDLLLNSRMIPAKIAGAFSIGFHVDTIGGNIANHKRAFSNTLKCLDALTALEHQKVLRPKQSSRYRKAMLELRESLMRRIDDLRELFHKMREES